MANASLTTPRVLDGVEILIEPITKSFSRDYNPYPHRKPVLGISNCLLCGPHRANRR
jgi:hypothetical protein